MILASGFAIASLYLIFFSFMMNTQDIRSAVCFKFVPFLIGSFNGVYALKLFGIV